MTKTDEHDEVDKAPGAALGLAARPVWHAVLVASGVRAWWLLLFLQPIPRLIGLKLALLLFIVAALIAGRRYAKGVRRLPVAPLAAGGLLLAWSLFSSALGPFPGDSFDAMRKELLYQVVLFAAALAYVRTPEDMWKALAALLAGFATLTLASGAELAGHLVATGLTTRPAHSHDMVWAGYAATAGMMVPTAAGWLLLRTHSVAHRLAGGLLLSLALLLLYYYGSRTPLLVIVAAVLLLLALSRAWKTLGAMLVAVALLVGGLQLAQVPGFERYQTLLRADTYVNNERNALWSIVSQVIADRPILGYGYGWKKLAWAMRDGNHIERWKQGHAEVLPAIPPELLPPLTVYGKANPHNYPLQVAFEIGVVGLVLALGFWALVVRTAIRLYREANANIAPVATLALTMLVAYFLSNITNGHWVGSLANAAVAIAGCVLALAGWPPTGRGPSNPSIPRPR